MMFRNGSLFHYGILNKGELLAHVATFGCWYLEAWIVSV